MPKEKKLCKHIMAVLQELLDELKKPEAKMVAEDERRLDCLERACRGDLEPNLDVGRIAYECQADAKAERNSSRYGKDQEAHS